jgi:hypothetical protein
MILNIQQLLGDSSPAPVLPSRTQEVELILPDEPDVRTSPPSLRFHGVKEPKTEIQQEKAIHRTAAYMIASGAKIRAVAEHLDVAENTVRTWTRQPFFQALVATIIHNEFSGDITSMLKNAAVEAVMVQTDLMHNSTSDQVRLKAAQDVLDRYRGKPTNFVHHTNGAISENPDEEIRRLENDLRLTETK